MRWTVVNELMLPTPSFSLVLTVFALIAIVKILADFF